MLDVKLNRCVGWKTNRVVVVYLQRLGVSHGEKCLGQAGLRATVGYWVLIRVSKI
jgi:hypothetical protein